MESLHELATAEKLTDNRRVIEIPIWRKGQVLYVSSSIEGNPADWDFYANNPYQIRIVAKTAPILFLMP